MNSIPDFRKWKIPDDEGSVIGLFRRTAYHFGIEYSDIIGKARNPPFPEARYCVYGFLTFRMDWGWTRIANACPFKADHSTIIYGARAYDNLLWGDDEYKARCAKAFEAMTFFINTLKTVSEGESK